ncbi:MAG: ubiquitin-like domain-containing protein [Faecalibacterium sp.]|nr:ubiquitin-like domain-containing protein [Faecalibacterium sp.]
MRPATAKGGTGILTVKRREHLLRWVQAIPMRFWVFCLSAACLAVTLYGMVDVLKIVSVTDSDGACRLVTTYKTDAAHLMQLSGIEAGEYDEVRYTGYADNLGNLNIQRAFNVALEADGKTQNVPMVEGTVAQALAQAGVDLGENDYTVPSLHTELQENDSITVHRVAYQDTVTYEAIPYETAYSYTSEFYKKPGTTITLQTGKDGQKAITNRERWVDGEKESSQVIATEVTLDPRTEIIRAYQSGAPASPKTGLDGTTAPPSSYRAVYTGRATGYYSSSVHRGAGRVRLQYGTCAVNPNIIPYGSLLYITSADGRYIYGYAIAADTGTALMDGRVLVDLYYETYQESYMNGAFTAMVYVVK